MKVKNIISLAAPLMMHAGAALAANSQFTGLGTVATGWEGIVTGPFALILIVTGGAVAAVAWIFSRSLIVAFETGVGLIGGGAFVALIATLITGLFPQAVALIR